MRVKKLTWNILGIIWFFSVLFLISAGRSQIGFVVYFTIIVSIIIYFLGIIHYKLSQLLDKEKNDTVDEQNK